MVEDLRNKFKCCYLECEWSFPTKYKLKRHLQTHTGEKPFACEICSKKFVSQYNLSSHLKKHNRINCIGKNCKSKFNTIQEMNQHELCCTTLFHCPKKRCFQNFVSEKELGKHLVNHDIPFLCTFENCRKRFSKPSLLSQHLMMHTGELTFKCTFVNCKKAFNTKQRLARHILIHDNKKSFACDFEGCGKAFNQYDYLKTHQRTHNSKNIICPFKTCQRQLACAESLKVHMRKHENNRPYKCNFLECDRSYLTQSNLNSHLKLHKEGKCFRKPYVDSYKQPTKEDKNHTSESICVNEFLNPQIYKNSSLSVESMSSSNVTKDSVLTAKLGEIICNQYISNDTEDLSNLMHQNLCNDSDNQPLTDLDIQFQEEFVSNIYTPSINNFGVYDSGHDYEQSNKLSDENHSTLFLLPCIEEMTNLNKNSTLSGNENDMLENSMELSTGHLVIDGCYMNEPSYMPDHIYSHRHSESKRTVNF